MTNCPSCKTLERMLTLLEKQIDQKDAQIAALLREPPVLALGAPETGATPSSEGTGQIITEEQRRREMADFIDDKGDACLVIDGVKVRVDEYQRTMARLDMELSGGRLF